LLVDTWGKDGGDLLSWLTAADLRKLVDDLHGRGVAVVLAGSLTRQHGQILRRIAPDWIGVRGAVCASDDRMGAIDVERVRLLKMELAG
jgi:(5-formylfuran-3-yl)methyl phosphate synthase